MEDRQDEVIEKIKKAMRLARKAGTDGERAAAEAAAKRLADAHGIRLESVEYTESDAKAVRVDGEEAKWTRTGKECHYACMILRKHFGVIVIQHFRRGCRKMQLDFIGSRLNIAVAEYVYEILWRESLRAWRAAHEAVKKEYDGLLLAHGLQHERDWAGRRKRPVLLKKDSFMSGWYARIDEKLTAHPLRNDMEQLAAEKKAAEDLLKRQQGIKDRNFHSDKSDRESMAKGYAEADKVNLSRPCEGRGRSPLQVGAANPFALAI